MQMNKLFHVLVVGGTLFAAGLAANEAQFTPTDEPAQKADLHSIFCTEPDACVEDQCTGKLKVKDGFECCWGTSCESN